MRLQVDLASPVPPYEQIRLGLAFMVASGELGPGTQLPPVRQLAGDLGLAPGTVARAYRELEEAGLAVARGRRGTFVAPSLEGVGPVRDRRLVSAAVADLVRYARRVGMDEDVVLAAVRRAWQTGAD